MPRILIQTVGTGGPGNPVWEALAFAVRDRRPDVLVQWCSERTAEETVPLFEETLEPDAHPDDVRRDVCKDPDELEDLTLEYTRRIDELWAEFPEAEIELDFTSGTKPMSAAAVSAAVGRGVPRLHYAVGKRDPSGRTVETERLVSIATDQVRAERQLRELGRLFNRGQFLAVAQQADRLVRELEDPTLRAWAESLAFLAKAYEAWDRFDWKDAFAKLREYEAHEVTGQEPEQAQRRKDARFSRAGWDVSRIANQVSHLAECKKGQTRPQRLVDLLANADRCLQRGRFDDAVTRLYRLTEYIGQVRFSHRFGINREKENPTSNVPVATLARHNSRLAEELNQRKGTDNGTVTLGLDDTITALKEVGDAVGQAMYRRYHGENGGKRQGPLYRQLQARNNSLLAHGGQPIGPDKARQLRETVGEILTEHLEDQGLELQNLLKPAMFLQCPWADERPSRAEQEA
jgi:CRISPR-associated protein (TIGR02710 family)